MARARNIAHEEIGRAVEHRVHDRFIEFENRHGNIWRVAREPQTRTGFDVRIDSGTENRTVHTPDWLGFNLAEPEREATNDRHSPNRQRRPESIPQGRNASRFGHSRRHRG